jgi:GNAT superfamily N-acetyltransferase
MTDRDIPAVAQLMRKLSEEYIVNEGSAAAASNFFRENDEQGLRNFVAAGIVYHVAERDDTILGFIAVREKKHLFHMFVDKQHHRQGIARALWAVARQAAIEAGNTGVFTVNSSNYALPVYKAMGFVPTAPKQFTNGLYYNPMQLDGSDSE